MRNRPKISLRSLENVGPGHFLIYLSVFQTSNCQVPIGLSLSFLPARRYASAGNSDRYVSVCLSVRPSVCHAPVLCQNEES